MEKIIIIDFAGTLIKREIIEEANEFRSEILKRANPKKEEHGDPELLYKNNRDYVAELTGIDENNKTLLKYRQNDLSFIDLTQADFLNQISANLFQIGMYMAAKKHDTDIFPDGMLDSLKELQSEGFKLAIITGVRTDIVSGVLHISDCPIEFDYIYGQPPKLGHDSQLDDINDLQKRGKIIASIGDKLSDLERTPDALKIFVTWGHAFGGEEDLADAVISDSAKIPDLVKSYTKSL